MLKYSEPEERVYFFLVSYLWESEEQQGKPWDGYFIRPFTDIKQHVSMH